MAKKKFVVGFTLGAPFDKTSRSSVNSSVFSIMANKINLIAAYDCSLTGLYRYICALKSFKPNINIWKKNFHQNPYAFEKRSFICDNYLKRHNKQYDAIYQDGAMFMPLKNDKLFVTNHDANVVLTAGGGKYSVGSHYSDNPTMLSKTIEQEKKVYERADRLFVRSEWVKSSLIKDFKIKENKIQINPSGVHFEVPENLKKEYKGKNILFVGKDLPIKGFDILLKAFDIMLKNKKNLVLHIVGTSHSVDMSSKHIKYYGFLGPDRISDLRKLYECADLFILPSRYDAFPKVLIEAGAYKVPCIATAVCGIPEIITEEYNGLLVQSGDYQAIARKGLDLLSDTKLSKYLGENGFKNYKNKFNWDKHVSEITRFINQNA